MSKKKGTSSQKEPIADREEPYLETDNMENSQVSVLTHREKVFLSGLVSFISLCSSLNTPIYWVAIPEIEKDFHITEEQANLTITAYLVLQAVSPMFICTLSDKWGRRPTILYCVLGSMASNIGLVFCPSYGIMIFLRCLLAAHAAPLIAITSAVVGDFTTRSDRGGYVGFTFGCTLIGSGIAPFIGACLDQRWKWQGIFAFTAIINAIALAIAFVLLPETSHVIVGNMSILPRHWIHRSPIIYLRGRGRIRTKESRIGKKYGFNTQELVKTVKLLKDPLVIFALVPNSIIYATWVMSQTTMTLSLTDSYHYEPIQVGLCFLAPGIACCTSAILCGKLLNYAYRKQQEGERIKNKGTKVRSSDGSVEPQSSALNADPQNPHIVHQPNIIRARLKYFQPSNLSVVVSTVLYGWTVNQHWNVAAIIVFAVLLTISSMYPQTATNTLLVDLHPESSGTVTSLNNLFRCGLASVFVSCISKMNTSLTIGGTYSLMAGICVISSICLPFVLRRSDSIIRERQTKKEDSESL